MLKWLISLILVVVLLAVVQPRVVAWLPWLRLGRLPGDFRLTVRGREYLFPFASVLLLALITSVLMRLL